MATIREFRPSDLSRLSLCNFDPFTETYDTSYYLDYYAKWPNLFLVCEDTNGSIVGYSTSWLVHRGARGALSTLVHWPSTDYNVSI
jgi:ribosomal protein S18 acetylase RimI-like enzyme